MFKYATKDGRVAALSPDLKVFLDSLPQRDLDELVVMEREWQGARQGNEASLLVRLIGDWFDDRGGKREWWCDLRVEE
jgi:hypothetical protein